jgi:hypothetical protein
MLLKRVRAVAHLSRLLIRFLFDLLSEEINVGIV